MRHNERSGQVPYMDGRCFCGENRGWSYRRTIIPDRFASMQEWWVANTGELEFPHRCRLPLHAEFTCDGCGALCTTDGKAILYPERHGCECAKAGM